MKRATFVFVIILSLQSDRSVFCQVLPIERYTVEDGLISNFITTIYQDSRGYLWLGSEDGFSIYDGFEFENYSRETSEFAFRNIFEFVESKRIKGRMWISCEGGVSYVQDGKFSNFRLQNQDEEKYMRILLEDKQGTLYCQDGKFIYSISSNGVTKDSSNKGILSLYYHKSIGDSLVYGLTGETHQFQMFRLQNGKFEVIPNSDSSRAFAGIPGLDKGNNVWVSFPDSSLVRFSTSSAPKRIALGSLGKIFDILWDNEGNFWGRFSSGFRKCRILNDSISILQTIPRGLIGRQMLLSFIDNENSLWFILLGHGIAKLDHSAFRVEFLLDETSFQNTLDKNGHVWIGLIDGVKEIWRDEQNQWFSNRHNRTAQWPGSHVRTIVIDSLNRMTLSFEELESGLFSMKRSKHDSSNIQFISTLQQAGVDENMYGVCDVLDSKNRMWSGKSDSIVIISMERMPHVLRRIASKDGLAASLISVIHEDRSHNFWFGSYYGGIYFLNQDSILNGTVRKISEGESTPTNGVRVLHQDRKGTLWVGTRYDGLYSYSERKFARYSLNDGLPSVQISGIVEDYDGRLWVQTGKGICFKSSDEPVQFRHLPEIVHEEGTLYLRNDSLLVLITSSRVVIFDPRERLTNTQPPQVYIRKFIVNGTERDYSGNLEFSHDENNCQIEFAGVSMRDGKTMRYQYQIGNEFAEWSEPTVQRNLWLASLQPGEYTMRIRAVNPYEVASIAPAILRFRILLPFWRRWWFLLSVGLLIIGGIYSLFRWRTNTMKHEQQLQQESARRLIELQETERKRIAGEIHDSLGQDFLVILNRANMALKANEQQKQVQQLREISSMAEQAIDEARSIAYNLSPYHLEQVGLTAALQSLIDNVASTTKISLSHQIDAIDNVFNKEVEVKVFRIVQECVNNIVKHSDATEASVEIKRYDDSIELYVRDNGKGFVFDNQSVNDIKKGFGLFGLQERVRSVHGTMAIRTSPGNGTAVNFIIPNHEGHARPSDRREETRS